MKHAWELWNHQKFNFTLISCLKFWINLKNKGCFHTFVRHCTTYVCMYKDVWYVYKYTVYTCTYYVCIYMYIGVCNWSMKGYYFSQAIALTGFVYMVELFPATHRSLPGIGLQLFWASGVMSLALLGFLFKNWRYLEVVMSAPCLLAIPMFWYVTTILIINQHYSRNKPALFLY